MDKVGLRELRQDASELVRRVERGEQIEITVAGRLAARLVPAPAEPRCWLDWTEIADLFDSTADDEWAVDRDRIDQTIVNPWDRAVESDT